MAKHKPHTQISPTLTRVAHTLYSVVHELSREHATPLTGRTLVRLARGIVLSAQAARLAPAQFDADNGHDALSAIAHSTSQRELLALADNNVLTLSERWSKVVYAATLELSGPSFTIRDLRRIADIEDDPPRSGYSNPKLFDKWIPK